MIDEKASSSSCNKNSLFSCLFHTRKSKTLCSPVAVQAIRKQLSSLRKALCISKEASCCHTSHSTSPTLNCYTFSRLTNVRVLFGTDCTESDVYWTVHHCDKWRIKKPTKCHFVFYCTSYRLSMFQALLCPTSGARDYDVVYHTGRVVLGLPYVGCEVQPAARTLLQPKCTSHPTYSKPRTTRPMW